MMTGEGSQASKQILMRGVSTGSRIGDGLESIKPHPVCHNEVRAAYLVTDQIITIKYELSTFDGTT